MSPSRLERVAVLVALALVLQLNSASSLVSPGSSSIAPAASLLVPLHNNLQSQVLGPPSDVEIAGEAAPDLQRVEPTIAVDPRNSSILVAGAQDLRLVNAGQHRWHGYYRSTDSGKTWSSSLLPGFPGDTSVEGLSSPLHHSNATSDPVLAFDRAGNLYYAGLVFNVSSTGRISGNLAFVAKYLNDGALYSRTTLITGPLFADKEWIAVDTTGGQYDGNVYMAFDANLTSSNYFGTLFTRSTDGGQTFSPPFYAPSDQIGELPDVTVDASGDVYVSSDAFDPVKGNPLNYTQVSRITGGGTMLVQNVKAVNPADWLQSSPTGASFRAFTIPQIAADVDGVYLVWEDLRLGNASVFFTRSIDKGSSWTIPLRISDTLIGQHFFPTITASGGIITMAWYDSRLNTGTSMTSLDVFYAYSLDHGQTFSPNLRVTSTSFNPGQVRRSDAPNYNQPFIGDYISITATTTTAHVIWTDNRDACDTIDPSYGCVDQDAFTAAIGLPDFSLTANPTSITVAQGLTGLTNVSLTSINGFSANASITASPTPNELPLSPRTTTVSLSTGKVAFFNLAFNPNASTTLQTYAVTITATSGPRSTSLSVYVTVQSPGTAVTTPTPGPGWADYVWPIVGLSAGILIGLLLFVLARRRRKPNQGDTVRC